MKKIKKTQKQLIEIADKIFALETQRALGKDVQSCESEIQIIADSLSLEDMMIIDEYIMDKKFLTN